MARQPLKRIDRSLATWTCNHCGERVKFTDDPRPIWKHLAFHCPIAEEWIQLNMVGYLKRSTGGIQDALAAHVMKHPEDGEATFDPRS